jgi:hypothetical protein
VETVDADLFQGSPVLARPIPPPTQIKMAGIKIAYESFTSERQLERQS